MNQNEVNERVEECRFWQRLVCFTDEDLTGIDFSGMDLTGAFFPRANLTGANFSKAICPHANFRDAILNGANFSFANLRRANFQGANLTRANLSYAEATKVYFEYANFTGADFTDTQLEDSKLDGAILNDVIGLKKKYDFKPGGIYWKRFESGLCNYSYQYQVGRNDLRGGETFAGDERQICSYPGFHFASREWCNDQYGDRPLEARIRIPEDAQINIPCASDGKASASAIEILEVFDARNSEDITDQFRNISDGRGCRIVI